MVFDRHELCRGVHTNILHTDKFKRNFVSVNFVFPHKKEYAALSSLLPDVLTRATNRFQELKLIERELDECYGAQLSAFASIKGESKIITVSVETLCDCYTMEDTSIFERVSTLLNGIIFDPYTENGCFSHEIVESEKEKLLASVGRRKNSKRYYALDMLKKNMCANEPYGVFSYGSEEDIASIDATELFSFYEKMINQSDIELFYVGPEEREKIDALFYGMFADKPRQVYNMQTYPEPIQAGEPRYLFENADYKQSVLTMGFRVDLGSDKRMRYAFSLFNSIFGSGVNSKLFKIVREKMNLCYYASCAPDLSKGIAFLSSGIDCKNEDITRKAIEEQFDAVKQGDFTDEDILDCKRSITNAYNELYDSPDGMSGWYLSHMIFGDDDTIEHVSESINSVTREEIIQAANCMKLDTVFVLRGISKVSSDIEVE